MTPRFLFLTALLAVTMLATAVHAHDPSLHEPAPAAKTKPITCEELADTERHSADLADEALKATCEAEANKVKESKNATEEERG